MIDLNETESTFINHITYYAIAHQNYCLLEQLVIERDQRKVKNDRDVDFHCEKNAAIQQIAMVTIIFSALTLEAFINYYGFEKFSTNFFNNHLDKLNTISKWLILPRLVVGKQLNTDGQSYELLKWLFKLRDSLVHFKTKKKRICDLNPDEVWIEEKHARKALEAVSNLVQELKNLDSTIDIEWLNEAKTDPYA